MTLIARNTTASGVSIADLSGFVFDPYEERDLSVYFSKAKLSESEDLDNFIQAGIIVLNDGEEDLPTSEALTQTELRTHREEDIRFMPFAGGTFTGDVFMGPNTISGTPGSHLYMSNLSGFNYNITGLPHDSFISLTDTPPTYEGLSDLFVRVNASETALKFVPVGFLDLYDTPATYSGYEGHILAVNAGQTGFEYVAPPPTSFLDLIDTPDTYNYTGESQYLKVKNDKTGLEYTTISGFDYSIIINSLTWQGTPTYDGDIHILGWHERIYNVPPHDVEDPFSLSSGGTVDSPEKLFHTHAVVDILTTTSTPFTLTISGTTVDEASGIYSKDSENITVTGTGYYQSGKSFVDEPEFKIAEATKSCTFDLYRTTYWDAGNSNFTVRGCIFEWTPDQPNWLVDVKICHIRADGSRHEIDSIVFDKDDTYTRADDSESGKYKRTDYNYHIYSATADEGIMICMNQRGIGNYYFELKYSFMTS